MPPVAAERVEWYVMLGQSIASVRDVHRPVRRPATASSPPIAPQS